MTWRPSPRTSPRKAQPKTDGIKSGRPPLAAVFPNLSVFGAMSPLWRGGNNNIQNPGFFPDVWLGASWNDPNSPVSARATTCIACHTDGGMGNRMELVEAVIRLDLAKAMGCSRPQLKAAVEAGRFIVPFGAFASQSNPGVYRTVSRPLIFNMGQRVLDGVIGDPVLPMPYADEGSMASFAMPLFGDVRGKRRRIHRQRLAGRRGWNQLRPQPRLRR